MNESLTYQVPGAGVSTRDRTHTLFAQTMGYVAVTAGLFFLDILNVFLFFLQIFSSQEKS